MRRLLLLFSAVLFGLSATAKETYLYIEKFTDFEIGHSFKVYDVKGTEIKSATATVQYAPGSTANKCLFVKTGTTPGYVELDIPDGLTGTKVTKSYDRIYMQLRYESGNTAAKGTNLKVLYGSTESFSGASGLNEAGKFVGQNYTTKSVSSFKKTVRIGLEAKNAEYYIDNVRYVNVYGYDINDETQTARYWADKLGKNIGCCISPNQISGSGRSVETFYKNFNMLVGENAMKMDATEPGNNSFNFSQGDQIVNFAKAHNMKVRGHTLCWHSQIPGWIGESNSGSNPKGWTKKQLMDILKNHITKTVQHYAFNVVEWDVVNETLSDAQSGSGYNLRDNSIWVKVIGREFIDSAFVWARRAADAVGDYNVKLYLNDYNVDSWNGGKTKAMYNLAVEMKKKGIPIDGIGMQTHTNTGYDLAGVETAVRKFQEAGLNCIFTEIDVKASNTASGLKTQAQKYEGIAEFVCKYDISPTMVVWGIDDNHSWIDDHETSVPLMFDPDMHAKQAYLSVVDMFKKYAEAAEAAAEVDDIEFDEDGLQKVEEKVDVYTLTGQKMASGIDRSEVDALPSGLYIVGGRKVYVK